MTHVDRETLLKYALETLEPGDQATVRLHLAECESCGVALREQQSAISRLASIDFQIAEGMPPRLPQRPRVLPKVARFAAVMAVGFVAGYVTGGLSTPPGEPSFSSTSCLRLSLDR